VGTRPSDTPEKVGKKRKKKKTLLLTMTFGHAGKGREKKKKKKKTNPGMSNPPEKGRFCRRIKKRNCPTVCVDSAGKLKRETSSDRQAN
jgi:hypothetical protein